MEVNTEEEQFNLIVKLLQDRIKAAESIGYEQTTREALMALEASALIGAVTYK